MAWVTDREVRAIVADEIARLEQPQSISPATIQGLVQVEIADQYEAREKKILETLSSQRDFLVGNTKWVVGGFFGLLVVFGAMISFIFGSQLDDRYFDALIGSSISETVETRIETSITAQSQESLKSTKEAIEQAAGEAQRNAVTSIENALSQRIEEILSQEVVQRIKQVTTEFTQQSNEEILSRLIPVGAVVAFDLANGCPDGWDEFTSGTGRVIIGAGQAEGLTERAFRSQGSNETHSHAVSGSTVGIGNPDGWSVTGQRGRAPEATGFNHSHPISGSAADSSHMPPFIALRLCKKTR